MDQNRVHFLAPQLLSILVRSDIGESKIIVLFKLFVLICSHGSTSERRINSFSEHPINLLACLNSVLKSEVDLGSTQVDNSNDPITFIFNI